MQNKNDELTAQFAQQGAALQTAQQHLRGMAQQLAASDKSAKCARGARCGSDAGGRVRIASKRGFVVEVRREVRTAFDSCPNMFEASQYATLRHSYLRWLSC